MDDADTTRRASLISLQPARLAPTLGLLNPMPRELLLQPPRSMPLPHGWGVLPASTYPLLLDMTGMDLTLITMLLSDLARHQRESNDVPLLLVPPSAMGVQQLIDGSSLSCVVVSAYAPAETIARWVLAPVQLLEGQVWVKLAPPRLPRLDPRLGPLLAALTRAPNMRQAAEWCYLSQRTVYTILTETCALLDLTLQRHHLSTAQWATILMSALSRKRAGATDEQTPLDGGTRHGKNSNQPRSPGRDARPLTVPSGAASQ
jgi:hypothetical protein